MVNGITGVGTNVSIEDIQAIVTETVEDILETQTTEQTQAKESADEESGLAENETQQTENSETNSINGFASILSALTTMMTTMMQALFQFAGIKTETNSNVQTNDNEQNSNAQRNNFSGYNTVDVISEAGLAKAYASDEKRKVESKDNSEENRRAELLTQMEADLNSLEKGLIAEIGDEMTDEIQSYINEAKMAVMANSDLITTSSKKYGFLNMHKKTLGEYSVKTVADTFFAEFNKLYMQK